MKLVEESNENFIDFTIDYSPFTFKIFPQMEKHCKHEEKIMPPLRQNIRMQSRGYHKLPMSWHQLYQ